MYCVWHGDGRALHLCIRRQRQMCMRDGSSDDSQTPPAGLVRVCKWRLPPRLGDRRRVAGGSCWRNRHRRVAAILQEARPRRAAAGAARGARGEGPPAAGGGGGGGPARGRAGRAPRRRRAEPRRVRGRRARGGRRLFLGRAHLALLRDLLLRRVLGAALAGLQVESIRRTMSPRPAARRCFKMAGRGGCRSLQRDVLICLLGTDPRCGSS